MSHIKQDFKHDLLITKQIAREARTGFMPWIIWGVAASFYLYEFFARVAPSVMSETLENDFSMNATEL